MSQLSYGHPNPIIWFPGRAEGLQSRIPAYPFSVISPSCEEKRCQRNGHFTYGVKYIPPVPGPSTSTWPGAPDSLPPFDKRENVNSRKVDQTRGGRDEVHEHLIASVSRRSGGRGEGNPRWPLLIVELPGIVDRQRIVSLASRSPGVHESSSRNVTRTSQGGQGQPRD
jgi:hypothetical protein